MKYIARVQFRPLRTTMFSTFGDAWLTVRRGVESAVVSPIRARRGPFGRIG